MNRTIKDEKMCEVCKCLFISKDGATLCKGCLSSPTKAAPGEKFVYQDVKRSDIEKKLNIIIHKLNKLLALGGTVDQDEPPKGYSKKCDTCGQVFIADAPAAKYCDTCKDKK